MTVPIHHRDGVAAAHAVCLQRIGQPADTGVEITVGLAMNVAVDDLMIGGGRQRRMQQLLDQQRISVGRRRKLDGVGGRQQYLRKVVFVCISRVILWTILSRRQLVSGRAKRGITEQFTTFYRQLRRLGRGRRRLPQAAAALRPGRNTSYSISSTQNSSSGTRHSDAMPGAEPRVRNMLSRTASSRPRGNSSQTWPRSFMRAARAKALLPSPQK